MLSLVILSSIALFLLMSFSTSGICYASKGTDCEQQVYAASKFHEWNAISDMHKYRTMFLKDVSILLLVFIQRLLRDTKTYYPVVITVNLANSVSLIFLYLNASFYWNEQTGIIMVVLYLMSVWPYIVMLFGGYQIVAQMFLLIAVFILNTQTDYYVWNNVLLFLCGTVVCLMMFSSSSSRKYLPLFILAFLYKYKTFLNPFWVFNLEIINSWDYKFLSIALIGSVCILNTLLIYGDNGTKVLKGWIQEKHIAPMKYFLKMNLNICLFILFMLIVFDDGFLVSKALVLILLGVGILLLALMYPNFRVNMGGYYAYLTTKIWATHHRIHDEYYKNKIGYTLQNGAGGTKWDISFIFKTLPFISAFYVASVFTVIYYMYKYRLDDSDYYLNVVILLFSISGIVWGRLTGGPQSLTAYFPVLLGLLLQISQGTYIYFTYIYSFDYHFALIIVSLCLGIIWNIYVLLSDVFPSKMGISKLIKYLRDNNIKELYTYNSPNNAGVVEVIVNESQGDFKIIYIKNISNLEEGYVLVPPISKQNVVHFESAKKDFNSDIVINNIINSKAIDKVLIRKFKTLGSSRYWLHTMDDLSYRDILFNDISSSDRYLSSCWLMDIEKINLIKYE